MRSKHCLETRHTRRCDSCALVNFSVIMIPVSMQIGIDVHVVKYTFASTSECLFMWLCGNTEIVGCDFGNDYRWCVQTK